MADELTVISSKKGMDMIQKGGYIYIFDKHGSNKIIWRCNQYQKCKCKVRMYTTGSKSNPKFLQEFQTHNHEPDAIGVEVKVLIGKIKTAAKASAASPANIIAEQLQFASQATQGALPIIQNLKRNIRRAREIKGDAGTATKAKGTIGKKIKEDTNKILSNFLRSFGSNELSSCVSCTGDLVSRFTSGTNTASIWKEICIKSIVPVHLRLVEVGYTSEDTQHLRFPFCQECSGLVSTLTDLYRQLTAIQEEYDKVRGAIMRGIVNTYGSLKQQEDSNFERDEDESEIFNCWKSAMGIETDLSNVTKEILLTSNMAAISVPEVVQFIDIKTEKMEEEEFLEMPEFLVPEVSSSLQHENNTTDPVNRFRRVVGNEFELAESLNSDNYNYTDHTKARNEINCESQPSDDESNKSSDNKDDQSVEDEYVPPYGIDDIPNIKRLTRNRAQSESVRIYNLTSLRSTDSEGSSQSECENGNSSNSTDSEKDEIGLSVGKKEKTNVRRRRRVKDETEVPYH